MIERYIYITTQCVNLSKYTQNGLHTLGALQHDIDSTNSLCNPWSAAWTGPKWMYTSVFSSAVL